MRTFIYISDARKLYANPFISADFTGYLSEVQYRVTQPIQKTIKLGFISRHFYPAELISDKS